MSSSDEITLSGELVQISPPIVRVIAATRSGLVLASVRGPLADLQRLRDEAIDRAHEAWTARRKVVEDDGAE